MTLFWIIFIIVCFVFAFAWKSNSEYEEAELKRLSKVKESNGEKYTEKEIREEIVPKSWCTWTVGICICLIIWMIGAAVTHWWAVKYFIVKDGDKSEALFGDSFGAVNALISAFAFAGMIVAFILQRYELRLQRKELEAQRKEFEQQNSTLALQRFENTFFHMMELQQQIVEDLSTNQTELICKDYREGNADFSKNELIDQNIHGRNLFFHAFCNIVHEIHEGNDEKTVLNVRGMKEVIEKGGFSLYEEMTTPTYFDHYFRHLYRILKFIDSNDQLLTQPGQYHYSSILRATLSRYELVWLYYNGLSGYGNIKLKPLIERYCMLKNLRVDLLCCSKENIDILGNANKRKAIQQLKDEHFSGTDYEFNLSSEHGDVTKYHISAFYNTLQEIEDGNELISNWRKRNAKINDESKDITRL